MAIEPSTYRRSGDPRGTSAPQSSASHQTAERRHRVGPSAQLAARPAVPERASGEGHVPLSRESKRSPWRRCARRRAGSSRSSAPGPRARRLRRPGGRAWRASCTSPRPTPRRSCWPPLPGHRPGGSRSSPGRRCAARSRRRAARGRPARPRRATRLHPSRRGAMDAHDRGRRCAWDTWRSRRADTNTALRTAPARSKRMTPRRSTARLAGALPRRRTDPSRWRAPGALSISVLSGVAARITDSARPHR
jgi:hypothetical protein